jgi:tRNA threonylcarbamoyladenosine biosynthesis protein TsaE
MFANVWRMRLRSWSRSAGGLVSTICGSGWLNFPCSKAISMIGTYTCTIPEETFALGEDIGAQLTGGEVLLLSGGLGAGKTLLTKGILDALGYDIDEVTSPSFTLVNLYKTEERNIYHIDLWRLNDGAGAAGAVGLHEILDEGDAIVIVEWAEKLKDFHFPGKVLRIMIEGDGDDPRKIVVS